MTTAGSSGAADGPPKRSGPSSRRPPSRTTAASSSTSSSDARLEAGRVARPHGLDGSFHVSAPVPRLLTLGATVRVGEHEAEIVRRVGTDRRPVIRLAGHETRAAAEALNGELLLVEAGHAPPLEEGEYWAHELAGCTVSDGGREVGFVRRMFELPSVEVLEVARPDGEDLLVPMVSEAVRSIDVAARRVDIDLGFLGAD